MRWLLTFLFLPVAMSGQAADVPALSPENAMKAIRLAEGFTLDLIASEPLVLDPVAFDWDTKGRLWVVEMADYPLGIGDDKAAGGRVRMLEDRDGDGTMDHSTLFAEGLNFPNGILTWRDGVIVTAAPEVLYLSDTTGDGRSDSREVLLEGLTEGNQQLRANGLRWGLDNWVYVAAGGHHGKYGVETKLYSSRNGTETRVGSRDFRFRPDTGVVEPQSGPTQFGRNRDDWGQWFGTQNARPLWHYVLPDHYLQRNPHYSAPEGRVLLPGDVGPPVFPAKPPQKRFHGFDQSGRFTSACSGMIYRDAALFSDEGTHAFTCEPFHNLVQRFALQRDGVSFTGERIGHEKEPDFFASTDRWCRPVMVRTGPDGGLWIADMYRYMIEHPQWLPQDGKDELLPFYREGDDKGRIYRIRKTEDEAEPLPKLELENAVEMLATSNGWVRDKAQQLILWQGDKSAVPALQELFTSSTDPRARLHAVCTLDGLDSLSEELILAALSDDHPGMRANALRLAEARLTPALESAITKMAADADASVRLQVAFTLGELAASDAAGQALFPLLESSDAFVVAAALSSVLPHFSNIVNKVTLDTAMDLRRQLADIALGMDDRKSFATLMSPALHDVGATVAMVDVLASRGVKVEDFQDGGLATAFQQQLEKARAAISDESEPVIDRIMAASLLARVDSDKATAMEFLASRISPANPPEELALVFRTLGATAISDVPGILLDAWPSLAPSARAQVIDQLLSRGPWTNELLAAVEAGAVKPSEFDPAHRARLTKHPNSQTRNRAVALLSSQAPSARADVVTRYRPALKLKGDPEKGLVVFQKACVACHKRGSIGEKDLGPDLVTVAGHPDEKILVNILDPNLDIQPGYHAYFCELKSGEQLFGLIAGENASGIILKMLEGAERSILRTDIVNLRSADISLMPEGLEAALTIKEVADVIAFLKQPAK